MAVIIKTKNPKRLLSNIKKSIDSGEIRTWSYDSDGDFTHATDQWRHKAWLTVKKIEEGELVLGILGNAGKNTSSITYAVYHGRFVEMLLFHFDEELTDVTTTALPTVFVDNITSNA